MAAARPASSIRSIPPSSPGQGAAPTRPRLRLVRASTGGRQPSGEAPAPAAGSGQTTLDLQFLLPGGLPAVAEAPSELLAPAPRRCPSLTLEDERLPTARSALPPAGPWAARLAQAVIEVCTAGRPVGQLLRWTEPTIYRDLEKRYLPQANRSLVSRRVIVAERVRSVHVCEPADGVAEVSVVIIGGERPRALALRIEGWRGRWVCTALDWI